MKIFALSAEWMNLIQSLNMLNEIPYSKDVLKVNHKWGVGEAGEKAAFVELFLSICIWAYDCWFLQGCAGKYLIQEGM